VTAEHVLAIMMSQNFQKKVKIQKVQMCRFVTFVVTGYDRSLRRAQGDCSRLATDVRPYKS